MKQLIINQENPNGIIVEIEAVTETLPPAEEPMRLFFEGLASADTNTVAKIRELAKQFLADTE